MSCHNFGQKIQAVRNEDFVMRFAGFLLLLAGWALILTALAILPSPAPRTVFVLSGLAVEVLGLVLAARAHRTLAGESE